MSAASLTRISPVFAVTDVDATARWYRDVLGFESGNFPQDAPAEFAILSRDGVEIFLQRVEDYRKPDLSPLREAGVWDAYIHLSGLQSLWDLVSSLPAARQPEDRWYGQREVEVRDPNGYLLVFAEEIGGGTP